MKAVMSHRIYMDCPADMQEDLDRELTYTIPAVSYTHLTLPTNREV